MDELLSKIEDLATLLGPNVYVQAAAIAAVFILAGKIADLLLTRVVSRLAERSTNDLDDSVIELIHRPIFVSFVLIGLGLATKRLGLGETPEFVTLGVLKTIGIFIWYSLASNLTAVLIQSSRRRATGKFVRSDMLALLHNVLKIAWVAVAAYFALAAWNIDPTIWLTSAGIVGLALSFAAKDTLANVFAGVSIVADAPYKVGDFIILDTGERGVVTQIGIRSTRLLTRDDIEITIPNSVIGNSKITNEAGGPSPKHRIRIKVGVSYGSDIDQVIATLEQVAADHEEVCTDPAPRVRFRAFGDSSLDFELLFWIARPIDRGRLHHEINCAVYKAFATNNIEIPFPQRDLHVRTMPPGD